MKSKLRWDIWTTITVIVFALFCVVLIYPLTSLFLSGFQNADTGSFTLDNFRKFFSKPYYYKALINSFYVTIVVTLLSIFIGIPLAYIMSAVKIKGKAVLEILIIISMLSPPFIGAYSWILLLGRNGVVTKFFEGALGIQVGNIYGFPGIVLVFTLKLFPYIYMYVSGALKKIDVSLSEAAENLGCNPLKKIFTIIMPLILPTTLAGALVVFTNALADFGTPMLIGEGFRVMPVLIYSEFVGETGGSANFAASLSIFMVLVTMIIFIGQRYVVSKKSYAMSSLKPIQPVKATGVKNIFFHAFVYIIVFLGILPQGTVIYTSFLKTKGPMFAEGYSLGSYKAVLNKSGASVLNTYKFAVITIIIIIILGMAIAYVSVRKKNLLTNILDTVTMFPMIISGSVLGITMLLAFNKRPLLLSGTATIMILTFVIRRLPYTVRSSSAILHQLSPSVEEASISLGYSPISTFFRITARMMMSGVLSGAILSWITTINELSSSIILYTGRTQTMSVAIFNEVSRGNYGNAAALSTILTATTVISIAVLFRITGSKEISM